MDPVTGQKEIRTPDGYVATKTKTGYHILGPKGQEYDVEKKANKWRCSCTGFKYRQHCKHIKMLPSAEPERFPRVKVDQVVKMYKKIISKFGKWEIVGSYRRGRKDVKDIDILLITSRARFEKLGDTLEDAGLEVVMRGKEIIRGWLGGMEFDITRVIEKEWPFYLLYRTGSAEFNIGMRAYIKKMGGKLNEHGLWIKGKKIKGIEKEEDIFKALGVSYIPPKMRKRWPYRFKESLVLVKIIERSATELKQEIKSLGLNPEGKSKKEMELLLATVYWAKKHPGKEFPDQFDPMLAKEVKKADKDWIRKNFKDTDWFLQEKINGMRSILTIKGKDVHMTSRARSVKNFMFKPHQDNVLGFQNLKNPFKGKTVLDGELLMPLKKINTGAVITGSTLQATVALVHMNPKDSLAIQKKYKSLEYNAFDILFFNGENVQTEPYDKRVLLLDVAVDMLKKENPKLPIRNVDIVKKYADAYQIFQDFLDRGAEGIMLKKRSSSYQQSKRSTDLLKLKGEVTVDGWISGFTASSEGRGHADMIGGLEISAYVNGREKVIASVSNLTLAIRKEATVLKGGKPVLNPKFLNRVVELVGQDWNKNQKLTHARINEWRPDKDKRDCKIEI